MSQQDDILPIAAEISSTTAPEDRSGPRSTEFWISLLTIVASLVVAFRPTIASKVGVDQIRQWATIAAGLASVGYAISRAITKHGAAQVRAAIVAASAPAALPPAPESDRLANPGSIPASIVEVPEPADATKAKAARPVRARRR